MFGGVPPFSGILHKNSQRIPPFIVHFDYKNAGARIRQYAQKNYFMFVQNSEIDFLAGLWYHIYKVKEDEKMNKEKALVLLKRYLKTSGADYTLWGFSHNGMVYAFVLNYDLTADRIRLTRESTKKGGAEKIALKKLTDVQRQALIAGGQATLICTEKYLKEQAEIYGLNMGMAFEQVISLRAGQGLYKKGDKRGYWECGDVEINGKQVQIKYEAASLASEPTIEKAERLRG